MNGKIIMHPTIFVRQYKLYLIIAQVWDHCNKMLAQKHEDFTRRRFLQRIFDRLIAKYSVCLNMQVDPI